VPHRLGWGHPSLWVQIQAALKEVDEGAVLTVPQGVGREILGSRRPAVLSPPGPSPGHLDRPVLPGTERAVARVSLRADELSGPLGRLQQLGRRHAEDLNNTGELIGLVLAGKERMASQKLRQDASEAPHVNRHAVAGTNDHLRCAIEARLNVRVDALVLVATRSEVNHLNMAAQEKLNFFAPFIRI